MPARPRMTLALAAGWFCLLAVLIAGPLLGGGYLLLLDYPSGPHFPDFSVFPLPSSGDVGNGVPLYALHTALRELVTTLPDKLYLVAPVVLGGIGVYRFVQRRLAVSALAAVYGGTLFVVNPFTYDRYLSGHLFFLLAYSLLPWAISPLFDLERRRWPRSACAIGLWIAALGAISVHIAGMYLLLTTVVALVTHSRHGLLAGAAGIGMGAVVSSYWLLPALIAQPGAELGIADVDVYESRPRGIGVLPNLVGLDGFWRNEFNGAAERHSSLYLLLVPILGFAFRGAMRLLRQDETRILAISLCVAAAAGVLLAAGTAFAPSADIFRWLYDHVPFFVAYREPQKFLALVVLGYAIFGAAGLDGFTPWFRQGAHAATRLATTVAVVAVVLGYGYTLFWGFAGQVELSRYPPGWSEADRLMDSRGVGRLLVFPWHLYAVWSFSDGRIVADPARSFFSRDVVAADEAGFRSVPKQSRDPFTYFVENVLRERGDVRWLGHLVAPLDIRFIAVFKEADWWNYAFASRQRDLTALYQDGRLTLFENEAWRGAEIGLANNGSTIGSLAALIGTRSERDVSQMLYSVPDLVPADERGFPPIARLLPRWRRVSQPVSGFVNTGERCSDGWRLGDEKPTCQLGAVAAFNGSHAEQLLWRPLVGARLLGFALSGLTLAGLGLYRRRAAH